MGKEKRPWFIPPIWLLIIMLGAGTFGSDLVYHALTNGTWLFGLLGLSLLLLAVLVLGTPLAYARYLRKTLSTRE